MATWFIEYAVLLGLLFLIMVIVALVQANRPGRRVRVATLQELRALSPKGFENAVATLLLDLGYKNIQVVGRSGDLARDIAAVEPSGIPVTVQCKRYMKSVGSPQVQLFIGMLQTEYRGSKGIYVTTANFTAPAVNLARRHGVQLWSGNILADLLVKVRTAQATTTIRQPS